MCVSCELAPVAFAFSSYDRTVGMIRRNRLVSDLLIQFSSKANCKGSKAKALPLELSK